MSDYYQMLGVAPTASPAEIRQAYARLAREKHPDRFTDPEAKRRAQTAFQDITTAFNALVNPRSRQEYDEQRHKPVLHTPEEIARDAFERATQLAPRSAQAFADLAVVLARQGLRLRAQKAVEAALRLAPRDARIARLAAELGLGGQ